MAPPTKSEREAAAQREKDAYYHRNIVTVETYMRGAIPWRQMVQNISPDFLTSQSDRRNIYIRGGQYYQYEDDAWAEYDAEGLLDYAEDENGVLEDPPGPPSPPNFRRPIEQIPGYQRGGPPGARALRMLPEGGLERAYQQALTSSQEESQASAQSGSKEHPHDGSQNKAQEEPQDRSQVRAQDGPQERAEGALGTRTEVQETAESHAAKLKALVTARAKEQLMKLRERYPRKNNIRRLRTWAGPVPEADPLTKEQRDLLPKVPSVAGPKLLMKPAEEAPDHRTSPLKKRRKRKY